MIVVCIFFLVLTVIAMSIGQTKIQTALTGGRQDIQLKAKNMLQELLNEYEAGVEIREISKKALFDE